MKLYDSYTHTKRDFVPIKPREISMYVCGITPNNATHMGHAFTYVSFDVLVRLFKSRGYMVHYIQNATDVNDSDDVIRQAAAAQTTWDAIAAHWINHFHTQMTDLNVLEPTQYVLASSVVPEIITANEKLIEKGHAYVAGGNVYFDVSTAPDYGHMCRYSREQMIKISRDRGNNPEDPLKKNPLDFVLWINSDIDPSWTSPWGKGRPGWHIECTAMINKYLGAQIDIHGGGRDLMFPHHESEIAQAEGYTGLRPFVNYWMHNSMVIYEGEKMSKSLGNLVLVEDMLKKYEADVLRWYLLSHHYRTPWEFVEDELHDTEIILTQVRAKAGFDEIGDQDYINGLLEDDMNTPDVLRYLQNHSSGAIITRTMELLGFKKTT